MSTPRVLVVDDNHLSRRAALAVCERSGVAAEQTDNGEEALRLLQDDRFSLALVDLRLRGLSGEALCGAVRARSSDHRVGLVAYTAHAGAADVRRLLQSGFDDVLLKPVSLADFERVLRNAGLTRA